MSPLNVKYRFWSVSHILHKGLLCLCGAVLIIVTFATAPLHASVNKIMLICETGVCPYFEASLLAPDGWEVDKTASQAYRTRFLVEEGKTFHNSSAVIYAKAVWNGDSKLLQELIDGHINDWQQRNLGTEVQFLEKIENAYLDEFELFVFENPELTSQPYEIVAFAMDFDDEGNEYWLTVVLTGKTKEDVQKYKKVYSTILSNYK